jgi:hypothetical protein
MGKFKAARPKSTDAAPQMKAGLPCIVLIVLGMFLTALLMYEVMKSAS